MRRFSFNFVVLLVVMLGVTTYAQVVPDKVNIPGTLQPELGCPGPWAPDCEDTLLDYYAEWDVWFRTFELPAGNYEYKVAIDGSWAENYGGFADRDGPNIALNVSEDVTITFYYDHKTNWIADDVRQTIVTAVGDFQTALGCSEDFQAECMLSWLQDVGGSGIYTWTTEAIPVGDYEARFAFNRDASVTYGEDGTADSDSIAFSVPEDNMPVAFTYDSTLNLMVVNVGGASLSAANIRERRAHWVLADTILWQDVNPNHYHQLLYSPTADINVTLFGLQGEYEVINLYNTGDPIPDGVAEKFPHLANRTPLFISPDDLALVPQILKGQFAVAAFDGTSDALMNITGVQIPGVLDDLYTYDGNLGITWDVNGIPTINLWAPTARNVDFLLYDNSAPNTAPVAYPMFYNENTGVWRIVGQPSWVGKFYLFDVEVFVPTEMAILNNRVTDPYSVSLAINSRLSQLVDLNASDLAPDGWHDLVKPDRINSPVDITVYEIHVRDFSAYDETVPEELRGTYLAFTLPEASGVQHLQGLVEAGLTHLHLLPTFDIATINENRARWFEPDPAELASFPPDSDQQQAILEPLRDLDGFNWGYDPYHFNVPEGSYSTNADGVTRIIEYRQMVQFLNEMGLYVVQDVVYNHTNGVAQSSRSVIDKIVPGYYYRLDDRGQVYTSTCCPNTATEHNMMRRLMIDSIILHATQYKIDGFRFDLMGHHMLEDMREVREALDALTLEEHGVDGASIFVYGEGWNFGEVQDNARGINATQLNIAGTGIGVFNDRLRDAVRGGSPFGGHLEQGLASLQYTRPNELDPLNDSLSEVLLHADQVRVGLAGNLADYAFIDRNGNQVTGRDVLYNQEPVGYTASPQENIIYVSKHDNETLYDEIIYKAHRDTTMEERVRMQNLALSYVMYAQGVPFFHAGSDMLRSKSMDRNSYNSGDWFNRLDFTYQTNNFGVGLPPAAYNSAQWDLMRPLLADTSLQPAQEHILANVNSFRDMLHVRYSTPLLRLQTAEDVIQRLTFHNTGAEQLPGVIVMHISDTVGDDLDPDHDAIVVIFNATPDELNFTLGDAVGADYALHPALATGSDTLLATASYNSETGTFTVPAISTAVFVLPQS